MHFCINYIDYSINKMKFKANFISEENLNQNNSIYSNHISEKNNEEEINQNNENEWYIQIEKIGLKAPIQEGTNKENLEDYVGLFENLLKNEEIYV